MTTPTTTQAFPGLVAGTWTIDPVHSEVGFTVRHLMSKVRGQFTQFEGSLEIADNPLESAASAVIDLSSVDTRNEDRDNHLRSADFFTVDETPQMTFQVTSLRQGDDGLVAAGDLSIRGVTKPVELSVDFLGVDNDPWGGTRVGLEATTSISRKEWGVSFNLPLEGDKVMIGDTVTIVIVVQAVHQGESA
ncbi:MAG: YceI family protein [Nocardioidaceae bacterium]